MIRTTLASTAALLAMGAPAAAAGDFEFQFTFDAEAVQTEQGARTVYRELSARVADQCETRGVSRRLADMISERTCQERTMASAIAQIEVPALTKIHAGETRRKPRG